MKKILVAIAAVVCALNLNAQNQQGCKNQQNCQNDSTKTNCCMTSSHHFTMSLGYGFSLSGDHDNLLQNYNTVENHNSKMRHGIDYRLDYEYNFHKNFAAGVVFNMYNAFDSYYEGDKMLGSSSDDRWIFFVGPSFMAHTNVISERYVFFAKATAGLMNFRNVQRCLVNSTDLLGNPSQSMVGTTYKRYTFGYGLSAGASYIFNKYLSLDCSIGYMGGSVSKVKANDKTFELDENEDLSRLNINVGIKIKL